MSMAIQIAMTKTRVAIITLMKAMITTTTKTMLTIHPHESNKQTMKDDQDNDDVVDLTSAASKNLRHDTNNINYI